MDTHSDWGEASDAVSELYFSHQLTPLERRSNAERVHADGRDLGPVRIAKVSWGSPVRLQSSHPGAFAVNLPVHGSLTSRIGSTELVATPNEATVYPPDTPAHIIEWDANVSIIGVRIEADYLRQEASKLFGSMPEMPPSIRLGADQDSDWADLVNTIAQNRHGHPLVREQLAGALTTAILLAAKPVEDDTLAACPKIVRSVVERLRAEPARAWTAADMAQVAGVSIRRLQQGFRDHLDTTPTDYLRLVRLERVRQELLAAAPGDSVTDIALANGVVHLGRFAAAYRRTYGERPSDTLRRVLGMT
ncbi:AraC family transcriptional regulator [Gulosibacter chungangensis]|uniref:AraC family transcriptional regulator n=1 Tax=Gulosibacter chungangensis TaxID=979746 RepID=A0A7J5BFS2_9MICO|nr:AraC family transcriptional regulator [Gulosibacter chungangensis]KAB1644948.1 AraC family transcriptional regulator [Gulosibacter chungangensis]